MNDINITPGDLHGAGDQLGSFGQRLATGGQKLEQVGQDLVSHASRDKSGVGSVIAKALGEGVKVTGKVFSEGGRVAGAAGKRLHSNATSHEHNEAHQKSVFDGIHDKGDDSKNRPHGGHDGGSGGSGKGGGGGGTKPDLSKSRPKDPDANSTPGDKKKCLSDPVDVATGDVVMTQRDVTLPGPLALLLDRTHVSSYRAGQWFGGSWASTVDQRIEVDRQGVCYFAPDGMILVYPTPAPGAPVLPRSGPRWPLAMDGVDGDYRITVPGSGRVLHFSGQPDPTTGVVPLRAVTDDDGNRIDVSYDDRGAPVELRHSAGYRVGLRTDGGRVTELHVLGDGPQDVLVLRYGYDEHGRLTELVNSSGLATHFDYDDDGRLTGWQDRNGTWYRYVYDRQGRCVRTVGAEGFYDGVFDYADDRTTYTDALGAVSTYEFDSARRTVRETDPLGNTTGYEWGPGHRLLARTDPLGRTTRFEYDGDADDPSAVVRPDGSRVVLRPETDGGLVIEVAAEGAVWRRRYEPGAVPDPLGEPLGVGGIDGRPGTADELAADRLRRAGVVDGPDRAQLDLFGRPRLVTDAFGRETRFGWTVDGRLAWLAGPGGQERWSYDGEGNEVEHVGVLNTADRHEYGAFDLVTATVDASGGRTGYAYDAERRLVALTDPAGQVWRYEYDAAGRLVGEVDFDGRRFAYSYDAAGQLVRSVNAAGQAVEYRYDTLGAAVERSTEDGTTRYRYDPVGRLVAATGPDTELAVRRDEQGRVVEHTVGGRTVAFEYDEDGRGMRRRTPAGVASRWSFDADGNPRTLATGGHLVRFEHDDAGHEISRRVDDTVLLRQIFDQDQRLAEQVVRVGPERRVAHEREYGYRPDGMPVGLTDSADGPVRYHVDPLGRVIEVTAQHRTESYRYDAAGNIVSSSGTTVPGTDVSGWQPDTTTGAREYTGNTLVGAGTERYRHDAQGRLVARWHGDRVWAYAWDALDRLTGVTTPDGTRWRYRYDPLGRRIAKQRLASGGDDVVEQVEFVWDGTVLIEQVHTGPDGRRVTTWEHHPDADRPLLQLEQDAADERCYSIVTDLAGAPVRMFDERGEQVWRSRANLWGDGVPSRTDAAETPLRFPGQYRDAETGLHYNVYRYYDPATGRYVSQDPLGLAPAPNPVAYVPNPLVGADPLGLTPDDGCASGSGSRGVKRPRPADDGTGAASTSSNKKPKTGQNFKPGDKVNSDLQGSAVDNYKNTMANGSRSEKRHASEALGEAGALDYLKKTTGNDNLTLKTASTDHPLDAGKFGLAQDKPWPHAVAFNGANVSDVAHWDGKTLHVVEAKGGSSQLTGGVPKGRIAKYDAGGNLIPNAAQQPNKVHLDQGTKPYLTDIGHAMKNSGVADGRNTVGQAILDGYGKNAVKYVPVSTSVTDGKAVVKVMHPYGS